MPALTKALNRTRGTNHDWRVMLRIQAVRALGQFGKEARTALPVLLEVLTDSGSVARQAATNALRNIAPEVLGKAAAQESPNLKQEN